MTFPGEVSQRNRRRANVQQMVKLRVHLAKFRVHLAARDSVGLRPSVEHGRVRGVRVSVRIWNFTGPHP